MDVRTGIEYSMSHINGSINISSLDIERQLKDLKKDKYYLVYCRSGSRSNSTANIMRADGFTKVINMTGGLDNWNSNDYPTTSSCCIM